jgi:hypothetical protein
VILSHIFFIVPREQLDPDLLNVKYNEDFSSNDSSHMLHNEISYQDLVENKKINDQEVEENNKRISNSKNKNEKEQQKLINTNHEKKKKKIQIKNNLKFIIRNIKKKKIEYE